MFDFFNKLGKFKKIKKDIIAIDEIANGTLLEFRSGKIDVNKIRQELTEIISLLKELPQLYKREIPYFEPGDVAFEQLGDLIKNDKSDFVSEAENLKRYLSKLGQQDINIVEGDNDLNNIGSDFELSKFKRHTLNLIKFTENSQKLIDVLEKKRRNKPRRLNKKIKRFNKNTPEFDRDKFRIYLHKARFIRKNGNIIYTTPINILANTLIANGFDTDKTVQYLLNTSNDNARSEKMKKNKKLFQTHIDDPQVFYWYVITVEGVTMLLCCDRYGAEHVNEVGHSPKEYGPPPNPAEPSNTWVEYGIEN